MRLGLIGRNISHSGSPAIYKKLIGEHVQYDLLDVANLNLLPKLQELATKYSGLNITSPYKTAYINQVTIEDSAVLSLGAINTMAFKGKEIFATNTDLIAVRSILNYFKARYTDLNLIILGSGVMANLTVILAQELGLPFQQLSRSQKMNMNQIDLSRYEVSHSQNIVINACSRDYIFEGRQCRENIFWDYNYHHLPHQNTLPLLVKEYYDGQEMLYLQAQAAVTFWKHNNY